MPKTIPKDFKPDDRSLTNLRKHGIFEDFIEDQLPGFISYWLETGKKKNSWQMTLQVWMKRAYQGKAGREWEENRHIRERYNTGVKGDLFGTVMDRITSTGEIIKNAKPEEIKTTDVGVQFRYSIPAPPDLPPMTFEQAQAELKRMGIVQ